MMPRPQKIISSFGLLLLFSCCAKMPSSVGKSRDVVIVASQIDSSLISDKLQIYHHYPQPEPAFAFLFSADTALKHFNRFHTLFLYGSLNHDFIRILLNPEAEEATKRDTFTLFKIRNLWAKDQLAIILACAEERYVSAGIAKYQHLIKKVLEDNYYERVKESYYETRMDQNLKNILHRFGIEFDLHPAWRVDSTYQDENFIFVHRHYPDRSIFFYKEKKSSELTEAFAFDKRNLLTKRYYRGDYILKELTTAEKIEFKDLSGIRLKGVWQNDSLVAGGPFLSYFFVDNDTLYVIDGMLFLPGERKMDFFTMLEVTLNSFKIVKQ